MKRSTRLLALTLLALTTSLQAEQIVESPLDWTDLFASGDFSKWTSVKGKPVDEGWTIENGVVHRAGIKPGDIITKEHYDDFELEFEWKISEGGNSGVKYRSRGRLGLEYQILDDGVHKDPNLSASLYALVPAAEDKPYNPGGEWNSGRIIARGSSIEHWINGKMAAEIEIGSEHWDAVFKQSKYKKHTGFGTWTGPILLQDHNDEVWYRNVRIRKL